MWAQALGTTAFASSYCSSILILVRRVWLLDLWRQYPNARLDGLDISIEQCPAPGFNPPGVSFHHLDILADIPPEYVEKYDVVHARLLVQVVNQAGGDPVPVIRNLLKLVST